MQWLHLLTYFTYFTYSGFIKYSDLFTFALRYFTYQSTLNNKNKNMFKIFANVLKIWNWNLLFADSLLVHVYNP